MKLSWYNLHVDELSRYNLYVDELSWYNLHVDELSRYNLYVDEFIMRTSISCNFKFRNFFQGRMDGKNWRNKQSRDNDVIGPLIFAIEVCRKLAINEMIKWMR